MKFKCDKCGTRYTISDEKVRRRVLKIRCKICEHIMVVRDPETAGGAALDAGPSRPAAARPRFVDAPTTVGDPRGPLAEVEWYAAPGGEQTGPMPLERLEALIRAGELTADDYLWNEMFDDWRPAREVPVLESWFEPRRQPPPLPPRTPPSAAGSSAPPSTGTRPARIAEPAAPSPPAAEAPRVEAPASPARVAEAAAPVSADRPSPTPGGSASPGAPSAPDPEERDAQPAGTEPPVASERPGGSDDTLLAPAASGGDATVPFDLPVSSLISPKGEPPPDDGATTASPSLGDAEESIDLPIADLEPPAPARSAPPPPRAEGRSRGALAVIVALVIGGGVGLAVALMPAADDAPPTAGAGERTRSTAAAPASGPPVDDAAVAVRAPDAAVPAPDAAVAERAPDAAAVAEGERPADRPGPSARRAEAEPPKPRELARPRSDEAPPAKEAPSRPSAFAGLDRGRKPVALPDLAPAGKKPDPDEGLPPTLSQAEITAVISRNQRSLHGCYERQLKRDDSLRSARATLKFRINRDGRAVDVQLEKRYDGTVLQKCLRNVVRRWRFPRFRGDPIPVEFPLIFQAAL